MSKKRVLLEFSYQGTDLSMDFNEIVRRFSMRNAIKKEDGNHSEYDIFRVNRSCWIYPEEYSQEKRVEVRGGDVVMIHRDGGITSMSFQNFSELYDVGPSRSILASDIELGDSDGC